VHTCLHAHARAPFNVLGSQEHMRLSLGAPLHYSVCLKPERGCTCLRAHMHVFLACRSACPCPWEHP